MHEDPKPVDAVDEELDELDPTAEVDLDLDEDSSEKSKPRESAVVKKTKKKSTRKPPRKRRPGGAEIRASKSGTRALRGRNSSYRRRSFSTTERRTVEALAEQGLSINDIARVLHVTDDTLQDCFWQELADRNLVSGKKPVFFAEEKRDHVRKMVAYGIPAHLIAEFYGVNAETIRRQFAHEFRTASVDLIVRVANSLARAALKGSVTACKFILSSRGFGAWQEASTLDVSLRGGAQAAGEVDLSKMSDEELEELRATVLRSSMKSIGVDPSNANEGATIKVEVGEPTDDEDMTDGQAMGFADRGGEESAQGDVSEPGEDAGADREGAG